MMDEAPIFLEKAEESLAGAESELTSGRYNNCANRAYYACFQAAVSALMRAGLRTPSASGQWSHRFVWAQFAGELISRRKIYSSDFRDTFERVFWLRRIADYRGELVGRNQAERAVARTRRVLAEIRSKGNA